MTYADVAAQLVDSLAPYCERIEIAGSIRRGKPDPHDIELVCIPKIEEQSIPIVGQLGFGGATEATEAVNRLDEWLECCKDSGDYHDRKGADGKGAWGPRFKRTLYEPQGYELAGVGLVPVDIFSVLPPAQWGVIFTIRTGPADFSHMLVTSRLQGGAMPSEFRVAGGQLRHGGVVVPTPEEIDFFKAIGLPYWEPEERSERRLRAWLAFQRRTEGARA